MDSQRFQKDLSAQIEYCAKRSPSFHAAFSGLKAELDGGRAPWLASLEKAWQGREFKTDFEAPFLLLVAARSWGWKEDGSLANFLTQAPVDFWERLAEARLQITEPDRAVGWLLAACMAFWTRNTPFHLVDMGTGGGLTLIGDYLPRNWKLVLPDGSEAAEPPKFRDTPYPVLSRLGLDARPRIVSDPEDRRWLLAGYFPEDAGRVERFDKAAELFTRLEKETSGPRLEACSFKDMPERAGRIKPDPEHGLLIFNSKATEFLSDANYAELGRGLAGTLAPWGDRGFWVELEVPRGKPADRKAYELTVHRLKGGRLESKVLARFGKPGEVVVLEGWDFLAPLEPVRPPKVTIEESPKQLEPGIYQFGTPKQGT